MINRNFMLLWIGRIISQIGDKFYAIALAWWILQKSNSPSIMGFFLLTSVLPGIILGFYAGVLTDRLRRKNILIITDILRGVLILILTYLSWGGFLIIWQVFVIGFLMSVVTAFFDPAIQAFTPDIVEHEKLPKANGLNQMVGGACTFIGPLMGAISVSILGVTSVFFVNGVSYFLSALLTAFVHIERTRKHSSENQKIWTDMKEGVSFIKNRKQIKLVLMVIAVVHFFIGGLTVAIPFLARYLNGSGVNNLGYLEMMLGIGLFAGAIIISLRKKPLITVKFLLEFITLVGSCLIIVSMMILLNFRSVLIYMPVLAIIGVSIAGASVFWQSLLQYYTPKEMMGRIFGLSALIGNTTLPVAYGIFGVLLNYSSVMIMMAINGFCLVFITFVIKHQGKRIENIR